MATKFALDVLDAETANWETIALFSDIVPLGVMANCGRDVWDRIEGAANVAVTDMDTGEILWNAVDDQEYDCEPADIDDDCGFDPYLGCYTDDC